MSNALTHDGNERVWMPHRVRRIETDRYVDTPAEFQVPTRGWNRVVGMPYLIYMPEKDRVLMLVYLDYRPCKAAIMISDDHGTTWSEPKLVPQEKEEMCLGTNLMYLGGGKVMFCDERNRWFSDDYGESWSEKMPVQPDVTGRPWAGWQWEPGLVDRDETGKVIRIAETAYSHNGGEYPNPGYFSQAYWRFSYDEGKTWEPDIAVPEWKHFNEVALCRAANGTIVASCRTDINQWYRDPAHRPDGLHEPDLYSGFGISLSIDNGKTWSQVNGLFEYGRHFSSMVVMPNHDIVMTYVVRIGYPYNVDGFVQYGIEAIVSRDHGVTWDLEHRLILDEWTGNLRGHNAWWSSPQSTSSVLLPDGSILTAYGRAADCLPTADGQIGPPRDIGLMRWKP
jgi:hypothetical protein